MTMISALIKFFVNVTQLGDATLSVSPNTYLTQEGAYENALAAAVSETPEIPAEILLGLAWAESRYHPKAVSRVEGDKRLTGIPPWKSPPKGTYSFFCGVTQVSAGNSWKKCLEFQNILVAYRTLVIELNRWLSPRICNHNLTCALTGYNGGFPAIKNGTGYAYVVMWRARLIKKALHRKES